MSRTEPVVTPTDIKSPGAARNGLLPDFIIIGEMKCGTTALARYLGLHPQVFMAPKKEIHYFDRNFDRGAEWYSGHFAGSSADQVRGEATAHYLYDPLAPARMHRLTPGVRLIALLRNPVARAYSQYWHARVRGSERLSFPEALDAEQERLQSRDPMTRWRFSYVDRGRYLAHIQRYLEFFPREQLHIVITEDLRSQPEETYAAVCRFLGVRADNAPAELRSGVNEFVMFRSPMVRYWTDRLPGPLRPVVNKMNMGKGRYPPMPQEIRERLVKVFQKDNKALGDWLGRDLSFWDK